MLNFTIFREQITFHEDVEKLVEKYNIDYKMASYIKNECLKNNINENDQDAVIRLIKLKEEPKSKKQIRTEEKQKAIEFLQSSFKNDKLKRESIDKKFKLMFKRNEK